MSVRSELQTLAGAIRFFTRLPLPGTLGHSGVALTKAIRYFPLAGALVAAIAALVFALCMLFWPKTLAVLAAITTVIYLTGAIHEDGWGDMVDGFGGGWDKQRILDIMKDSCMGSFGVTSLIIVLLARFLALVEIDIALIPAALVAGHAFSRGCSTAILATMDYVRDEGKAKPFDNHLGVGGIACAGLTALLPLAMFPFVQVVPAVAGALLATLWLARLFKKRIGGYTGDCLGATQQLAEIAFYGGLLCKFS